MTHPSETHRRIPTLGELREVVPNAPPLAPGELLDLKTLIAAVERVVTDLDPEPLALPASALEHAARSLRESVPLLEAVQRRLTAANRS